ncbi:MAG: hypothetical protein JNM50_09560 [Chromatiales bacterium]|jgi:hypothetical protein|nr:hypothetical protein [Chromatiales bacterium]
MTSSGGEDLTPALLERFAELERSHEDIPGIMDRLEAGALTLHEARLLCRELQRRQVPVDGGGSRGDH